MEGHTHESYTAVTIDQQIAILKIGCKVVVYTLCYCIMCIQQLYCYQPTEAVYCIVYLPDENRPLLPDDPLLRPSRSPRSPVSYTRHLSASPEIRVQKSYIGPMM